MGDSRKHELAMDAELDEPIQCVSLNKTEITCRAKAQETAVMTEDEVREPSTDAQAGNYQRRSANGPSWPGYQRQLQWLTRAGKVEQRGAMVDIGASWKIYAVLL